MELSCSSNEKITIFPEMKLHTFWSQPSKLFPKEISYIFSYKNLLWKNFLRFLERKLFLYFLKWNHALFRLSLRNKKNLPRENFLYFRKRKPWKNFLHFSQMKAILMFLETKPPKKFFIFQEVTCKIKKQSFLN